MNPTKLERDTLGARSVGPLLLRRGARLVLERLLFPVLRPLTRLGFIGRDERPEAPPTTAWVSRRHKPRSDAR
jgi:hypothetical protein